MRGKEGKTYMASMVWQEKDILVIEVPYDIGTSTLSLHKRKIYSVHAYDMSCTCVVSRCVNSN